MGMIILLAASALAGFFLMFRGSEITVVPDVNGMQLDNRGMYAAIMVNNGNDANVIPFFNALLQAGLQGQESAQSSDTETK